MSPDDLGQSCDTAAIGDAHIATRCVTKESGRICLKAVRVLAVADASALPGLRRAISPESTELVGVASTLTSVLAQLRRVCPDVAVVDLSLSQTDVFQLIAQLVQEHAVAVLALASGEDTARSAERALAAGASDVVERRGAGASWHDESGSPHVLSLRVLAVAASARPRPSKLSLRVGRMSLPGGSGRVPPPSAAAGLAGAASSGLPPTAARSSGPAAGLPGTEPSRSPLSAARLSGLPAPRPSMPLTATVELVAIGASTGGTLALAELLKALPANAPPMLVVQHMLPEFTSHFAERLNAACELQVRLAEDGEPIQRGTVLLAPGGRHLGVIRDRGQRLRARVSDEPPVGKHRPSVDVLFQACAETLGKSALGVLLTGMGDDGARGLLAMHNAGARTLVQDQASSVCFGMPSAAIAIGAAQQVLPLREIAHALRELLAT